MMLVTFITIWLAIGRNKADVKTFYGIKSVSFAKYKPWNASMTGTLKFKFKTRKANGILLYMDDHKNPKGNGNFLKLRLVDKRLELHLQVSYSINMNVFNVQTLNKKLLLGYNLNDNQYHYVELQRNGEETIFALDGKTAVVKFANQIVNINSSVYIGGVPYVTRLFNDKEAIYESRFVGCVSHLRYDNGKVVSGVSLPLVKALEESGTGKGCRDLCLIEPTKTCSNGAKCLNKYVETGCDCRGTGFTGENCLQQSESLHFAGLEYVFWKPEFELNDYASEILLRFRTAQSSGILLFATGIEVKDGYLLVELYQRSLIIYFKTKDCEKEIITLGNNQINQSSWRFLRILRSGRSISVHLDDGTSERRYLKQIHIPERTLPHGYLQITQVYIGGVKYPHSITVSKSKKHFIGCMQDIVINQFDIVEQTINWKDETVRKVGNLRRGCDNAIFKSGDDFLPGNNQSMNGINTSGMEASERSIKKREIVYVTVQKQKESTNQNMTWIVVGSCCSLLFIIGTAFVAYRCIRQKQELEKKRFREKYLKQCQLRQGDHEELPLNQKCIRSEINKPALKTFSPIRRAFYVSPNDADTFERPHEVEHRSYEAMVHHRSELRDDSVTQQHRSPQCKAKQRHYEPANYSMDVVCKRGHSKMQVIKEQRNDEMMGSRSTMHRCRKIDQH